ncbi:hypothetical protein EMIHUDRAFT_442541 [Emiliania huxleyi CCMP1516]|uniref:Uncharacterized protein n=2 Tax=Emiliania huxleyi TaxID=2903 RepID=A0A0D3K3U9_EMIH1|nr:hypothetical protein EMIHUDRAFT_437577 [Emiliania huxleyi CCMP1516]XP_005782863.1 hypothetical protein EMIHUDRAFT_442541 [Emiliania huxleyi CCMP1516]EOD11601.1 hypothetical protein EMIHUDRAFT_437577 [Emiliania huxleyi CCMP1516]EOD30434.1 hypothetical protein EMIHUDRAFT_442541 [Emiliania huxleyi CCMP1516]|eukprot:XP_005764030.1 hypothetical protein EMIHUDRAFT_437577 [Emiliania huxleyi CCMP1516]
MQAAEAAAGGEPSAGVMQRHGIPIAMWTAVSLNVAAFFSQGDEGVQILFHLEEFEAPLLSPDTPQERLTERLERVARGAPLNDSLKLALAQSAGLSGRLIDIALGAEPNASQTARNHAAKVVEYICASPPAALLLLERGEHARLVRAVADPDAALYLRKTFAAALCSMAALPEAVPLLAAEGAVGALHAAQASSQAVRRKKACGGCAGEARGGDRSEARPPAPARGRAHPSLLTAAARELGRPPTWPPAELARLPAAERALVAEYAAAEAEARAQPLHAARSSLIESGVLLYLHTAGGGAAWGLFESVRQRLDRAALVQNVARTSLVTCFVPILLVGGVVTAYNKWNKATDTVEEKFRLYFALALALYPSGRLLQWVETFAPLWLGGHIVGFASFFTWTLYTESDLMRSDRELEQARGAARQAA